MACVNDNMKTNVNDNMKTNKQIFSSTIIAEYDLRLRNKQLIQKFVRTLIKNSCNTKRQVCECGIASDLNNNYNATFETI